MSHRALTTAIALLLPVAGVSAHDLSECSNAKAISGSELRRIAVARAVNGNERGAELILSTWKFRIARDGCTYLVSAFSVPSRLGGHFSVWVDTNGQVVRYMGGM
jgi:hypothetical protein